MSARDVARAIDAFRRGWPVRIGGATADALSVLPTETADAATLAEFAPAGCDMLLSHERAVALGLLAPADTGHGDAVRITIDATPMSMLAVATGLADPMADGAGRDGSIVRVVPTDAETAAAALELARLAHLLPALFIRDQQGDPVDVRASAILDHDDGQTLRIVARAALPTGHDDGCEIVVFRSIADSTEHIALVFGSPDGEAPLVRVHSECLTGDVFGSLKCDCGPQLDDALSRIAASGWGMVLYLRQEGRGIGLANKIRAYALQQRGFDTMEANTHLGFAPDSRRYRNASEMLRLLGQAKIRLLTNNPAKIDAMRASGIEVIAEPIVVDANRHNRNYIETKRRRFGHLFR